MAESRAVLNPCPHSSPYSKFTTAGRQNLPRRFSHHFNKKHLLHAMPNGGPTLPNIQKDGKRLSLNGRAMPDNSISVFQSHSCQLDTAIADADNDILAQGTVRPAKARIDDFQDLASGVQRRCIHLEESPVQPNVSPLATHLLQRVVRLMQAKFDIGLTLAMLAAESGYSRAHFLRTFKLATGQTPHRYLNNLRLTRARELISGHSMSLIDIAATCGFSSHAHFSTSFRGKFGLSPSQYRRH